MIDSCSVSGKLRLHGGRYGRFILWVGRLRLRRGRHGGQGLSHGGQRLVQFVHLGRFQQKTAYPQLNRRLGVFKVAEPGEYGNLQAGEFTFQCSDHRETIHAWHPDIRE